MKTLTPMPYRRAACSALLLFATLGIARAQQTNTSSTDSTEKDEPIVLSPYIAKETQGEGYVSNDAATGLKSTQLLIDIPQSITVAPRDLIDDLGQWKSTVDVVKYVSAGTVPYAGTGEFQMQRGFRLGYALIDGQYDQSVYSDPISYDSYEVVKGPAAVLYGSARTSLAGIINKITRKPLDVSRSSVRLIAGQGNLYRAELDSGGPLTSLGSTRVSYRVYGAYQKDDGFERVDYDNRRVAGGGFKFDFNPNTSLLVQVDALQDKNFGIHNGIENQAQTGMYFGPGYDAGYKAKWSHQKVDREWYRVTFTHSFNRDWHFVASLTDTEYFRHDREIRNADNPDWVHDILPQYPFGWNSTGSLLTFETDAQGEYDIAHLHNQSNFGLQVDRYTANDAYWFLDVFNTTSITNPQVYDMPMPAYTSANVSDVGHSTSESASVYYNHTLQVIPDRLSLVAGISKSLNTIQSIDDTSKSTTTQDQKGTPHRLGAVFKPIKGLSLFVNDSTTFQGGGGRTPQGTVRPPQIGEVKEVGIKTALFDGRLSATISYFDLGVTGIGVTVYQGNTYIESDTGKINNKGEEVQVAWRITDGLTVIGSYYNGNIVGVDGKRPTDTINHSGSAIARYKFETGALKGFQVGATAYYQGDRAGAAWKPFTVYGAFFGYQWDRVTAMVNVDNLADKKYSTGGWGNFYMDAGAPRNFKATIGYRF